jgi:hypothetical protein
LQATVKVHEFFKAPEFLINLKPVAGAFEVLNKHKERFDFVVVTSRQLCIQEQTVLWIKERFPDIFTDFKFGNHYGVSGEKRSKLEICTDIGAVCLIDDAVKYAKQCAPALHHVLLFGECVIAVTRV